MARRRDRFGKDQELNRRQGEADVATDQVNAGERVNVPDRLIVVIAFRVRWRRGQPAGRLPVAKNYWTRNLLPRAIQRFPVGHGLSIPKAAPPPY